MFSPEQYRAKAFEAGELIKTSIGTDQRHEFQDLQKSFTVLADNEQWLADNYQYTVCVPEQDPTISTVRAEEPALAQEEERALRGRGGGDHAMEYLAHKITKGALRQCRFHAGTVGDCCAEGRNRALSARA